MTNSGSQEIKILTIGEWVKSAQDGKIVLPMIQRGSVWKPHQILDLWDTLLRAMPLGSMMSSPVKEATKVFNLISRVTDDAKYGSINLLDGQQRTLAILAGWPGIGDKFHRRVEIWVDIGDEPQGEYCFRLLATTQPQPFGFERASNGGQSLSKLATWERRLANAVYRPSQGTESKDTKPLSEVWHSAGFMPWKAKLALPLSFLIESKGQFDIDQEINKRIEAFERHISKETQNAVNSEDVFQAIKRHFDAKCTELKKLRDVSSEEHRKMCSRLDVLKASLERLPNIQFPLIPIEDRHLDEESASEGDPPLAILFKRIGSGGQGLSNEDYIFSLIKHNAPKTHDLVETLLTPGNDDSRFARSRIAGVYTPNALVMAAVRMTLLLLRKEATDDTSKRTFADRVKMDKAEFAKLVRKEKGFLSTFQDLIEPGGLFSTSLVGSLNAIAYSNSFKQGLPQHALGWLVDQSLFDVVLSWACRGELSRIEDSRLAIVRFLLWGRLCILDSGKASQHCIRAMDGLDERTDIQVFPDKKLIKKLIEERVALPLPAPHDLEKGLGGLIFSENKSGGLRGWKRFDYASYPDIDENERFKIDVYKRWWNLRGGGYHHAFLLWLQRDLVFEKFEECPALAGMEEETPYDFDHILPYRYWGDFRGSGEPEALRSNDNGRSHIGNALGNLRIWPSAENRSDGDSLPHIKLEAEEYRLTSHVDLSNQPWFAEDFGSSSDVSKYWEKPNRASNFQKAVEKRTFALYQAFYTDLKMDEVIWPESLH